MVGSGIAERGTHRAWLGLSRAPSVAAVLAFAILLLAAQPAGGAIEAFNQRFFLTVECPVHNCVKTVKHSGSTFRTGLLYWIADQSLTSNSVTYNVVDEQGKIKTVSGPRSTSRYGPFFIQGRYDWAGGQPALTQLGTAWPQRVYRDVIDVLYRGFPLIQIIGCGILGGLFWLGRQGRRGLGRYGKDEFGPVVVVIGAGLLVAGYLPGAQYHEILQSLESYRAYVLSRRIGPGLYLPLEARYGVVYPTWYWIVSLVHGAALIGGGAIIIGWLMSNIRTLAAGVHYAFVPHPAAAPVNRALNVGWQHPIDGPAVARALERTPDPARASPPAFVSKVKAKQAEELKERLEQEAKLAEAIKNREKARAEAEFWAKQVNEHERRRRL